jgi:hypothetical protein
VRSITSGFPLQTNFTRPATGITFEFLVVKAAENCVAEVIMAKGNRSQKKEVKKKKKAQPKAAPATCRGF